MFTIKCRWVRQKGGDRRISRTDASHFLSSPAPPTTSTSYYPISPGSCYLNLLLPHLATGESPGSYYVPPTSSSPTPPIFTTSPSHPSSMIFRESFERSCWVWKRWVEDCMRVGALGSSRTSQEIFTRPATHSHSLRLGSFDYFHFQDIFTRPATHTLTQS